MYGAPCMAAWLAASTGMGASTILEYDLASNILLMAGTYKTVLAIDTAIASIKTPYAMSWVANIEYTYDGSSSAQALAVWDTLSFGNSANMASKTTWTCPTAGLWHIAATFGFSMNTNDQACSFQLIIMGQRYGTLLLGTTLHMQVRVSPHSVSQASSTLPLVTPLSGI